MRLLFSCCITGLIFLSACGGGGGGSSTPPPTTTTPTPTPSSGSSCTTGSLVPVNNPSLVTVAGTDVAGVDITVGPPQTCPTENAEVLGVADTGATTATASNTGAQIHPGDTKIVLLFGNGLSGNMNVSISGQNDFTIGPAQSITAKGSNTPGLEFTVTVSPTAALGARTVILRAPNGDVTTFAGGLEVVP